LAHLPIALSGQLIDLGEHPTSSASAETVLIPARWSD
jgi:hypothetical protein